MASVNDVQRLAALARIRIPESELPAFAAEFDSILTYIGQLDSLTLTHGSTPARAVRNVLRDDAHPTTPGTWTEKIVNLFPRKRGNALLVKQVISHD